MQNLSVITACVPSLKPFFDSLETGFIGNNDLRRRTDGIYSTPFREPHELAGAFRGDATDVGRLEGNVSPVKGGRPVWDIESHSNQTNFIKQTKTWTIEGSSGLR